MKRREPLPPVPMETPQSLVQSAPQYQGHPDQRFGSVSYAQHGDDLMILNIFNLIGIERPSYLDLGAHHPTTISNTKLLYDRGSRGVNVDANPNLIEAFRRERPEDITVHCGVGRVPGQANFFLYDDHSGLNTFSVGQVKSLQGVLEVTKQIQVTIKTLDQIVAEYCGDRLPDLLNVDVEGLDFDVLSAAYLGRGELKVVCVETRRNESQRMRYMLERKGFFCYCRMGENLIFVHAAERGKVY